jgi:recombination associated protein RdgC
MDAQLKNLIFYTAMDGEDMRNWPAFADPSDLSTLESALQDNAFVDCKPTEAARSGWIPPAKHTDQLVQYVQGAWLMRFRVQTRTVPAAEVKKALAERVEQIEKAESRKVGGKEKRQLKDDIIMDLLPRIFSKNKDTYILVMPGANLIAIDAATFTQAEAVLKGLREALGTLPVKSTALENLSHIMGNWMQQGRADDAFVLGCDCKLIDIEKRSITIKGEDLTSDEVLSHLDGGYRVGIMNVVFSDTHSLNLNEDGRITGIKPTETYFEKRDNELGEEGEAAALFETNLFLNSTMARELAEAMERVVRGEVSEAA